MNRWSIGLLVFLLIIPAGMIFAQGGQLSAAVTILSEELHFQRVDTDAELRLPAGASAPFGIGDRIRTGDNGRALVTINDDDQLLLLPNSELEVRLFERDDEGNVRFEAFLSGIAVHRLTSVASSTSFQLSTELFTITEAENQFAVWAVEGGLQAVTSFDGEITFTLNDGESYTVPPESGFAFLYSNEAVELRFPLHASQVVAKSVDCPGIVSTNGSEGLRLRAGAALDYQVVDILQDGQQVTIVGTTENGKWYRIPFQTGFGWIFSSLIEANCDGLQTFPDLIGEEPESLSGATEQEVELLEAFYGTPQTNTTFYR